MSLMDRIFDKAQRVGVAVVIGTEGGAEARLLMTAKVCGREADQENGGGNETAWMNETGSGNGTENWSDVIVSTGATTIGGRTVMNVKDPWSAGRKMDRQAGANLEIRAAL